MIKKRVFQKQSEVEVYYQIKLFGQWYTVGHVIRCI